jgi:uncharacterized protein YcnI
MHAKSTVITLWSILCVGLFPRAAAAHVTVVSGVAFANTTQEISLGVAHGCAGVDTSSVRVEIPAGVTSVRAERSDFGAVSMETDATGAVTAVDWQKPDSDLLPSDIAYYKLVMRIKVPNQPFTTLLFPAHQTCKDPSGNTTTEDWVADPGDPAVAAGTANPAPALVIVPARQPGWNTFTVPATIPDLSAYFADALIVWKGTSAYSANATTTTLIAETPGVGALSSLSANDQIWVRY